MTIAEFVAANNLTMTCEYASENPNLYDPKWTADHWLCTIRMGRRRLTVPFSQGMGHNGAEPIVADVMGCLAGDALFIADTFEEWASDPGYATDSRRAEQTYQACKRTRARLIRFFGQSMFESFMNCQAD
jgi:hypothetical protein